jgi:hypothetical protein
MPYIAKERRKRYDRTIEEILEALPDNSEEAAGDFTYVIYRLLTKFNGRYYERALGMGSLVMACMEMYRRSHGPYEDEKIWEHGDL